MITLTAGVVNIVLNIIFIPLFGLWAVVGSTVISFALTAVIAQYLSTKYHFSVRYDLKFIGVVSLLALIVLFIGLQVDFGDMFLDVLFKVFIVCCFFVGVYRSNYRNVRLYLNLIINPVLTRLGFR